MIRKKVQFVCRAALFLCILLCLKNAVADASTASATDLKALLADGFSVTASIKLNGAASSDGKRLDQLNAMLKHVTLALEGIPTESGSETSAAVHVDGVEAVKMQLTESSRGQVMSVSVLPGQSFETALTAADLLSMLGLEIDGGDGIWNVIRKTQEAARILEDAYVLAERIGETLSAYAQEKAVRSTIGKMGTARHKTTITVPKEEAGALQRGVLNACPEGPLKERIVGLTFDGKQSVVVLRNEDGAPIKVTYSGSCGASADKLRTVSLTWTMRRDADDIRDAFEMKSPAKSGRDRDMISFERRQLTKNGTVSLELSYRHERVTNGDKTVAACEADLEGTPGETGTVLRGSAAFKHAPGGDKETQTVTLTPELILKDQTTGTVGFVWKSAKRILADAELALTVSAADRRLAAAPDSVTELDTLSDADIAALRQSIESKVRKALTARLVLLPDGDAAYLLDGLDDAAVNRVIDAAKKALQP